MAWRFHFPIRKYDFNMVTFRKINTNSQGVCDWCDPWEL